MGNGGSEHPAAGKLQALIWHNPLLPFRTFIPKLVTIPNPRNTAALRPNFTGLPRFGLRPFSASPPDPIGPRQDPFRQSAPSNWQPA
jgi:hypothetical protein